MSFLKYLHRLERIDDLIRRKATGNPKEFANKMSLCRSALMGYIREMKELGAPIAYCRRRESYYYEEEKELFIGFAKNRLAKEQERAIGGGTNFFQRYFIGPDIMDLQDLICQRNKMSDMDNYA
jgi:hypothetical protein